MFIDCINKIFVGKNTEAVFYCGKNVTMGRNGNKKIKVKKAVEDDRQLLLNIYNSSVRQS